MPILNLRKNKIKLNFVDVQLCSLWHPEDGLKIDRNTGHTQKNGAVSKEFTIDTAPFFCVCPVYVGEFREIY
jgi:hypothetical protein